jgi:hypothetical protein
LACLAAFFAVQNGTEDCRGLQLDFYEYSLVLLFDSSAAARSVGRVVGGRAILGRFTAGGS